MNLDNDMKYGFQGATTQPTCWKVAQQADRKARNCLLLHVTWLIEVWLNKLRIGSLSSRKISAPFPEGSVIFVWRFVCGFTGKPKRKPLFCRVQPSKDAPRRLSDQSWVRQAWAQGVNRCTKNPPRPAEGLSLDGPQPSP